MTDLNTVFDKIENHGVTFERLHEALNCHDDWGGMVHAFEYLTVLGVVEGAWKKHREDTNE